MSEDRSLGIVHLQLTVNWQLVLVVKGAILYHRCDIQQGVAKGHQKRSRALVSPLLRPKDNTIMKEQKYRNKTITPINTALMESQEANNTWQMHPFN